MLRSVMLRPHPHQTPVERADTLSLKPFPPQASVTPSGSKFSPVSSGGVPRALLAPQGQCRAHGFRKHARPDFSHRAPWDRTPAPFPPRILSPQSRYSNHSPLLPLTRTQLTAPRVAAALSACDLSSSGVCMILLTFQISPETSPVREKGPQYPPAPCWHSAHTSATLRSTTCLIFPTPLVSGILFIVKDYCLQNPQDRNLVCLAHSCFPGF